MVKQRKAASSDRSGPTARLGAADAHLCLDLINTEGVERNNPPDRLEDLDLFFEWAVRHGVVDEAGAATLRGHLGSGRAGERFLAEARRFREALYRVFSGIAADRELPADDLAVIDRRIAQALPSLRLNREGERFGWRLAAPPRRPEELLWPIALSAADLLCSERLDRVKECGGDTCSWMFIDESRNRSRRWCDMADCGNRAKARRYYRRHSSAD